MPGRKYQAGTGYYRYGFNGQEKSIDVTSGNYTALFWEYDSRIVRRWNIDPILKSWESSYLCFGGNPIQFSDLNGDDKGQRDKAIAKAKEYVDKKKAGNQYKMGKKSEPGGLVDCSGLVSKCIKAGEEKDPNHGDKGSGVLNIENNLPKVDLKNIEVGNLITFRNTALGAYKYHVGIVSDIQRDKDDNITGVSFIQSSGGVGPNEKTISTTSDYAWGKIKIEGFYKWDSKPDIEKPAIDKTSSNSVEAFKTSYIYNFWMLSLPRTESKQWREKPSNEDNSVLKDLFIDFKIF